MTEPERPYFLDLSYINFINSENKMLLQYVTLKNISNLHVYEKNNVDSYMNNVCI